MDLHKHPDDTSIDRPTLPAFHPHRLQECEDAMAGAITGVMDEAEAAGWTIAEICIPITSLADSIMLHDVDLEETNCLLRDMLRHRETVGQQY